MLKPAQGQQGVEDFIFETAKLAGPNPCPPMVLGVGIGGTFERCALLAKKALLRVTASISILSMGKWNSVCWSGSMN